MATEEFRNREDRVRSYLRDLDHISRDFPEFKLDEIEEYKAHFLRLDADGSGDLDIFEVQRMYEGLGQTKTNLELREIIAEVDEDNSGTIDFREFLTMMVAPRRTGKPAPIVLRGRIATSSLADRARFFESLGRDEDKDYEEKQRRLREERARERREKEERDREEEEERKRRRAEFMAKANASFGGSS